MYFWTKNLYHIISFLRSLLFYHWKLICMYMTKFNGSLTLVRYQHQHLCIEHNTRINTEQAANFSNLDYVKSQLLWMASAPVYPELGFNVGRGSSGMGLISNFFIRSVTKRKSVFRANDSPKQNLLPKRRKVIVLNTRSIYNNKRQRITHAKWNEWIVFNNISVCI